MYGSHLSIAGGMHLALLGAEALGLETVQVFTKNQQQWHAPPLADEAVALWSTHLGRLGFTQTISHDSYLINLASPDETLWRKSIDGFIEEYRRCEVLKIPLLVTHPGAHCGSDETAALRRVAKALDQVHQRFPRGKTITCLECTAGQGSSLGHRLEHLAKIMEQTDSSERVAVCLDTAHLFAAGYDLRGVGYDKFRKALSRTVGLKRVRALHLNDSKKPLGSRVDRHEHIGQGMIGLEGFRGIVRDPAFAKVPKILETPKAGSAPDGRPWDAVNLEALRSLE